MKIAQNNANTLQDAKCDIPPAVWLRQIGEGQRERGRHKSCTSQARWVIASKEGEKLRGARKNNWLSDPPCLRHSVSRRFFDQRQQGWSEPEERTTNHTSLGKDLLPLKTKEILCECHVERIIAKRTALESTAALSNYSHHRECALRQILPEFFLPMTWIKNLR